MSVTLFHHPGAGEGHWSAERMLEALRAAGYDTVLSERGTDDWAAALAKTDELAIVAGGDGTVAKVMALLGERDLPLAILPTGSGNNIARSLGVMGPLEEIIPRLPRARTSPMRLCRARGPWGEDLIAEGVGFGATAHSVLELQNEKLDGEEKLIRGRDALISAVHAQEPLDLRIKINGHILDGDFLMVEVLNLPMIGPNIRFVADTELAGDCLSVAILPTAERETFVEWLAKGGVGIAPLKHIQGRLVGLEGGPQPVRWEDKTQDWDGTCIAIEPEPHRIRILRPGDHQ
jgi:diacylglycerol kinase (ATP)